MGLRDTIGLAFKRFFYEGFRRDEWQRPERVIEALVLAPGVVVADLGSGTGYFTLRFARAVGSSGRVFAIDTDTSLLAEIARSAAAEGLANVVTVEAGDQLELPVPVDVVFLSNVYHHLTDQQRYFADARTLLAPGGRVAIVESRPEGLFARFFGHSTDPALIARVMNAAGYRLDASHDFVDGKSFQVFSPSDSSEAGPAKEV